MVGGNGLGQLKFNEPFYHLTTALSRDGYYAVKPRGALTSTSEFSIPPRIAEYRFP